MPARAGQILIQHVYGSVRNSRFSAREARSSDGTPHLLDWGRIAHIIDMPAASVPLNERRDFVLLDGEQFLTVRVSHHQSPPMRETGGEF